MGKSCRMRQGGVGGDEEDWMNNNDHGYSKQGEELEMWMKLKWR